MKVSQKTEDIARTLLGNPSLSTYAAMAWNLLEGKEDHLQDIVAEPSSNIEIGFLKNPPQPTYQHIQELAKIIEQRPDVIHDNSFKNMHVKGIHSLALHMAPELLLRLYVGQAEHMSPILTDFNNQAFLHHHHQYHFLAQTLEGTAVNQRFIKSPDPNGWYEYHFSSIIKGEGSLIFQGEVNLIPFQKEYVQKRQAYFMQAPEIHRVWFIPSEKTGWFINLFWEFREQDAPKNVYIQQKIADLPDREVLYQKFSVKELETLIQGMIDTLEKESQDK